MPLPVLPRYPAARTSVTHVRKPAWAQRQPTWESAASGVTGPAGIIWQRSPPILRIRAIISIGTATAGMINTQCGQCHIVGSRADIARAPDDPSMSARQQ